MKIFYHPLSFPSLAPIFTASYMEVDYEIAQVDLANGEQNGAAYKAINPLGKVPAMQDGDFSIGESAAIMRYIARKHGSDIYPSDIKAQAKVDQWLDYVNHHIRSPIARVHFNRSLAPLFDMEPDMNSLAAGETMLANNFPVIEAVLSEQNHLCGASISLADIGLLAALEPIEMSKIDISPYKVLSAWRDARRSEPAYLAVHSHYAAELEM